MAKTPQACGCGCGGMTKGGRFLPGHDARFHAAQKEGQLGRAIAHATGAHGTAPDAGPDEDGYRRAMANEKPGDEPPVGDGVLADKGGTKVAPGMWVRATKSGAAREGIVYNVDTFGNIAFIDDEGKQHIGYTGMTWVVDTNVRRKPNPSQRRVLINIGREVPGMMGKQ